MTTLGWKMMGCVDDGGEGEVELSWECEWMGGTVGKRPRGEPRSLIVRAPTYSKWSN